MRREIEAYLALLNGEVPAAPDHLRRMAQALDALAFAMADLPPGRFVDSDLEPPRLDRDALREAIGTRFPEFGFYDWADPLTAGGTEILTSDAVNDALDIASDLSEARWRFEALGDDDAFYYLHQWFRLHWGRHLMNLRSYIHARLYED